MTTSHLHYADNNSNGGVTLGSITGVYAHSGVDREQQVHVRFQKACARLALSRAEAERLQKELLLVLGTNRIQGDISGAAWNGATE